MGTRCVTVFKNKQVKYAYDDHGRYIGEDGMESVEICRFYRHWDGYPEGHGMDIARSIIEANDDVRKNNRNWAQHVLARLFACNADMELEKHDQRHGDLDFIYVVECDYANYGGKVGVGEYNVTITCYDAWSMTALFNGSAEEFTKWAMRDEE